MQALAKLKGALRVDKPTYTKDIVGDIAQWDERNTLFARSDLFRYFGADSPQYQAHYAHHPEHLEYDKKINRPPGLGLGRTGSAADAPPGTTRDMSGMGGMSGMPGVSEDTSGMSRESGGEGAATTEGKAE